MPNLQSLDNGGAVAGGSIRIDNFDVSFHDDLKVLNKVWNPQPKNSQNVGELLYDFFHYFAYEFPYSEGVLSIRRAKILSKSCKRWTKEVNYEKLKNNLTYLVLHPFSEAQKRTSISFVSRILLS